MSNITRLPTGISQAFWCSPEKDGWRFFPAPMPDLSRPEMGPSEPIAWFDELLEGGIGFPPPGESQSRALTVLLSGPPGSGKSTLALETIYRWLGRRLLERELNFLYVTSESSAEWLHEKAVAYGWRIQESQFHPIQKAEPPPNLPYVDIMEVDEIDHFRDCAKTVTQSIKTLVQAISDTMRIDSNRGDSDRPRARARTGGKILSIRQPDVLVIDSLNTVARSEQADLFSRFLRLRSAGPRLILIVLDSPQAGAGADFWEYACDMVIQMGHKHERDYMVRTIEVKKARYQSHAWGVHQLKIYAPFRPRATTSPTERWREMRRAHPYREEGGIFVFPSIHFFLSKYKRRSPDVLPAPEATPIESLNRILQGGLPKGRCTGLMGLRGGHKSHLGYLHLLHRVIEHGAKALIVSLRDDEGMARQTLNRILEQQFHTALRQKFGKDANLETLERSDLVEILYYPPGYITPEEFFHRMILSVQRLRHSRSRGNGVAGDVTVLFNSLDQLGARFPLCARQDIFVPGIIETLCAEGITSVFVGVEEPGQPPEQYGLLSMADLILTFHRRKFKRDAYLGHIDQSFQFSRRLSQERIQKVGENLGTDMTAVVLSVQRFAGGQAAGAGGILELVKRKETDPSAPDLHELFNTEGLCFCPFSARFEGGESLQK